MSSTILALLAYSVLQPSTKAALVHAIGIFLDELLHNDIEFIFSPNDDSPSDVEGTVMRIERPSEVLARMVEDPDSLPFLHLPSRDVQRVSPSLKHPKAKSFVRLKKTRAQF
jgi:hypothetical protein